MLQSTQNRPPCSTVSRRKVKEMYVRPVFDVLCSVSSSPLDDEAKTTVAAMNAYRLAFDSALLDVLAIRDHLDCKLD
jgi:hypothetical protein